MKGVLFSLGIGFLTMAMSIKPEINMQVIDEANLCAKSINFPSYINARELYRLNCAGCHGMDRQGNPPIFPSLVNIKDKKSKVEIVTQIKNGKGAMPPLAHLSDAEITAIIGYLYNEEADETLVADLDLDPIQKGEMLYKSNCTGCHRSITTDPRPQNANTQMCGMMEPATLSGVPNWYSKDGFARVLDKGPCYMPSFGFMDRDDKEAIYDYLATLQDPGTPRQPGRGMMMHRKGKRKRGWMCY